MTAPRRIRTDILVLGSGGAGLLAALHAKDAAPELQVTVAVKGLLGKSGCTRMVQGGYNVAIAEGDSAERHFMDTLDGGKWLNDQDLAWTLVTVAQDRIRELENRWGCFFDRNPDGTIHQKAFAGQTFDRTVHKGDLTGIEIINRLAEQVWARGIERLEEHRAVALIRTADGSRLSGVLLVDVRSGELVFCQARAVLLGTGGGPTMYTYHTPSGDKSCDGMAMALQAGLPLRDMEMVQFHPTGVLAGPGTRMTGTIIEEGLRGAGGYLLGGDGERFMHKYDPRLERATRDIVSRSMYREMLAGNVNAEGGLWIEMRHLGAEKVRRMFKGMVERCADCGFDLAGGRVPVVPTAHYMMGGLVFAPDGSTELPGLFAAGEDTGGVHGANRLGGNGVANSTVFGGIAGDSMGRWVPRHGAFEEPDRAALEAAIAATLAPFGRPAAPLSPIRDGLHALMWEKAGILRDAAGLAEAARGLDALEAELDAAGLDGQDRAFNLTWHDWLNLKSLVLVSRSIVAAAEARRESRGAHWREDFPETDAGRDGLSHTVATLAAGRIALDWRPVHFTRLQPGESLLAAAE
ncbi:L-aspartate oxidase [Siccirubricoccus sp. G192]|uniref:L-aspartate oxidase n=1 Tax=Siccirubricoccus sp. G192 TaxID=2849651 RepID=UPI001C2C6BC4|nr:FAD-binding protein [Siccirubricoccus sp. G192]MBV1799503.1 FAD-binding protein [Siccirubricoccus sp. G192]